MDLDFDRQQIEAATAAALGNDPADDPLVAELAAPEALSVAVGVDLAERLVPSEGADADAVADGAAAFVWGLLVSANLSPAEHGILETLEDGLSLVLREGRTTVIARHCDLAGVADAERSVGAALRRRPDRAAGVLQSFLQLFELGLAVGLAARYA